MNPESEIQDPEIMEPEDGIEEIDGDSSPSVDEFLMELEAKEKDLHITADYQIEIADSDFDEASVPEFVQQELTVTGNSGEPIASAQSAGMKTRVFELEKEIASLNNKLTALRMERNDVQEKSDRRLKDFESYKYRMDRERRGSVINQIGNLATQLLPVLDNLDRALDSIKDVPDEKRGDFNQFFDGIALVNQQINDVLSGMGVQPITTVGETFDPNFHEAVATDNDSDLPPNTISAEMLRGYRIGNLVIRHSMVRVTATPMPVTSKSKATEEVQESTVADPEPKQFDILPAESPADAEDASS
ncbi:MAG: nucleotide exchange factor GrpE [Chloracidobacterium sp.]|nr:nucleotide exchange factor GrpE [Chloracidobacterium sp.]